VGRQTRFFALQADYPSLAGELRSMGAVVIARRATSSTPCELDLAQINGSVFACITQRRYLDDLRPDYVENLDLWLFRMQDAALAELSLQQPRDGILRASRLYYRAEEIPEPEFIVFVESVRRFLRRWCDRRDGLLVSPSVAALCESGELARVEQLESFRFAEAVFPGPAGLFIHRISRVYL
jgi:hypothetical protein